ncbi:MAG TPA: Mur ligase family protein, partial [Rhabdochlamydiaceae bacterium]|nr:Mur ligase family protein [Rhabdochlamydiaceae bacterium]
KGSVSGKIAKACSLAGLKTGLFTSPHLFCFEERIKIDDQMIPKEKMATGLLKLFHIAEEEGFTPTLFEMVTFLAFDYFREEKVEIAIIEVGMGGRLDATNLISPLVSIITSISREHVQYLGETLDEIAAEKAGILKPNTPAVIGPKAHLEPIVKKAKELECPLHEVSGAYSFYDYENQAIAGVALSILSKKIALSKKNIKEGLQFRPSCRFEIRGGMIFDVAHNPDGFMRLQQALKTHYPDEQFRFVIGMSPTKEIEPSFRAIVANASAFHLVQSQDGLTVPTHQLEPHVKKLEIPYFLEKTIGEAIRNAKAASTPNERIVVCGSFYIMLESYHC